MAKQQITLSPEALAALNGPVMSANGTVYGSDYNAIFVMARHPHISQSARDTLAAALAQLINAAFTPAAEPAPESNAELRQAVGL